MGHIFGSFTSPTYCRSTMRAESARESLDWRPKGADTARGVL